MDIQFIELTTPTSDIVEAFNRWENDPDLVHLTRPSLTKTELERKAVVTLEDLKERLKHHHIYLIYVDKRLVGEMNYMVNPPHLYKNTPKTAWIGITIGEDEGRGKGVGAKAVKYLEKQIEQQGIKRIELGVFEFNLNAQKLYKKLGYTEFVRIVDFTYWQQKMWSDIRMEKFLS
ncbi:GNAT family N-acetyltransferase [Halobacillus sp. BBL2006]|uniref:GNAT family N-acetyltransferase n=1 Tax=Halobacillus sp. BBL2006 TaxID=1543706 RepID=UPI000542F0A7|nr:GNAT family N-acetyltransferase [Halobacillus sp. BBL2006]KHE69361.1 hypothetical protein LD39_13010 [Halobacillus sp. BBL2006]